MNQFKSEKSRKRNARMSDNTYSWKGCGRSAKSERQIGYMNQVKPLFRRSK